MGIWGYYWVGGVMAWVVYTVIMTLGTLGTLGTPRPHGNPPPLALPGVSPLSTQRPHCPRDGTVEYKRGHPSPPERRETPCQLTNPYLFRPERTLRQLEHIVKAREYPELLQPPKDNYHPPPGHWGSETATIRQQP